MIVNTCLTVNANLPHIIVSVVCLTNAAEQDCHDARQTEYLGDQEGGVGHEDEEGGFEQRKIPDMRKLCQQSGRASEDGTDEKRSSKNSDEFSHRLEKDHVGWTGVVFSVCFFVVFEGSRDHDGDGVVQNALAEHEGVQVHVHAEIAEYGKASH